MRKKSLIALAGICGVTVLLLGTFALSKRLRRRESPPPRDSVVVRSYATPADRQISAAQGVVDRAPQLSKGYNLLAAAYMQKARETGDFGFTVRADAAVKRSLEIEPDNYDGVKFQAYVLLSYHRFAEAREAALRAVHLNSGDYEAYGALTDSLVELGDYSEARRAVQQMLDLRPYTASYARASYLRSLYGDTSGAIEAMRLAAESASPSDPESMAWCYVHLGDELMNAGKLVEAEHEYDHALFAFPDYHLALAAKARARLAAGDLNGAVDFYKRAEDRVPLPDTAIALGDLYTKLGRGDDAKRQYDLIEFIERTSAASGTYSRQLALFDADHDRVNEGLAIARRERDARSDIFTCDLLAWCLYKKGELVEARKSIDDAMRLGTREARINYHAGMIYKALGARQEAAKYLQLALKINPYFDVLQADVARQTLHAMSA